MTKLFLRIYISVLASFALTLTVVLAWLLHETPKDRAVVEQTLRGGVALALERLEGHALQERPALLASMQERFGYGVRIFARSELTASIAVLAQLEANGDPLYVSPNLYVHYDEDEVLVFGPIPDFEVGPGVAWVVALVTLVWAVASVLLLRPVLRTTKRFERAAEEMSTGNLSVRIDVRRVALKRLARSFNVMAEKTEALVADHRHLLAAVSHEFRTPLARLRFAREMAGDTESAEDRAQLLSEMDTDIQELDELVAELIEYIRLGGADSQTRNDTFIAGELVQQLLASQSKNGCRIELHDETGSTQTPLQDARLFARIVKNLVANARRYATSTVLVKIKPNQAGGIWLSVGDDGPGIPESDRSRVLEPFVRLGDSPNDPGYGLGLAIVSRIVEKNGGEVIIDSSELGGARVSISWSDRS